MILQEQHIALKIYHHNELIKYDVFEIFKDDGVIFKIFHDGEYFFTLIPKMDECLSFELFRADYDIHKPVDWDLYSKIEVSLYSVFLKEMPS